MGTVPEGGLLLTAGVDVQKNRIEMEIVAWGRNRQSWSVDYRVLEGDTTQKEVWDSLVQVLDEDFPTFYGGPARIMKCAVDTGFNTLAAYDFVREMTTLRVMGVKGDTHGSSLCNAPSLVEVGPAGKKLRHGVRLWPVNVSIGKEQLYRWLHSSVPNLEAGEPWPQGFCHFPMYSKEFFDQLCSEQLVTRTTGGMRRSVWEKKRDRNEALDCRIYAMAAAASLRLESWRAEKWDDLEKSLTVERIKPLPSAAKVLPSERRPIPKFEAFGGVGGDDD
jgi:phage terminase large subunit GpA-like protein